MPRREASPRRRERTTASGGQWRRGRGAVVQLQQRREYRERAISALCQHTHTHTERDCSSNFHCCSVTRVTVRLKKRAETLRQRHVIPPFGFQISTSFNGHAISRHDAHHQLCLIQRPSSSKTTHTHTKTKKTLTIQSLNFIESPLKFIHQRATS